MYVKKTKQLYMWLFFLYLKPLNVMMCTKTNVLCFLSDKVESGKYKIAQLYAPNNIRTSMIPRCDVY